MIVATLLPPEARPRLVPYLLLAAVAACLRAAATLLLVPLLGALFSATPREALPWLGALAASIATGWALERHLVIRAFDLGFAMMTSMNRRLVDHLLAVPIGWFGAGQQAQAKRALAGAVPELLFEGGIVANIRIARPSANEAAVHAAASAAGVDEIVARLGRWDAPVGEGGGALSGGERQRVSIARALLKDAPILLLDEATSGLDTLNEAAVMTALSRFGQRTVLIVAHRLETIARADQILFVEDGRVIEAGSRDELIAAGGRFADYWSDRQGARAWRFDRDAV